MKARGRGQALAGPTALISSGAAPFSCSLLTSVPFSLLLRARAVPSDLKIYAPAYAPGSTGSPCR